MLTKNEKSLFCKIFVNTNLAHGELIAKTASLTHGVIEQWTIVCNLYEISVVENDEYDEIKYQDKDEGFLFSKFFLEIEPIATLTNKTTYISDISKLLEGLWQEGYSAVAACDFEDLLPNKGGYRIKNLA